MKNTKTHTEPTKTNNDQTSVINKENQQEEIETELVQEVLIDINELLEKFDMIRLVIPTTPADKIETSEGTELVFTNKDYAN